VTVLFSSENRKENRFKKFDFKMAEYDLTKTIIPYLDRHLAFPLLTHLYESGLFSQDQVEAAQYELAKGTNMVDYIVSLYEQLNPDSDVPEGENQLASLPFRPRSDTKPNQNLLQSEKRRLRSMSSCNRKQRPYST
jgi:hypothetical protein